MLNISSLSFKFLGAVLLVLSIIFVILSIYVSHIVVILVAIVCVLVSLSIRKRNAYIIFSTQQVVFGKIGDVLNLLKLSFARDSTKITIEKTKTSAKVIPFIGATILVFNVCDKKSKTESYIVKTLVKLQY